MKFSEIFYEKFSHKFSDRDFGDGEINKVSIPDNIDYDRLEVYAHSKDVIYVYTFVSKRKGIHSMWRGTFSNPIEFINKIEIYDDKKDKEFAYEMLHPNSSKSLIEFSGVEPLDPNDVFSNYHGKTHLPKQFHMSKGFADDIVNGVRTDDEWTKN